MPLNNSSEVDSPGADHEQLLEKEDYEPELQHEFDVLRASYKRLQRWVVVLSFLLGLICLGLFIAMINTQWRHRIDGKPSSPVPSMPIQKVTFERDDRFAGPSSPENDQAWGALMPEGNGFVVINDYKEHGLPPGKQSDNGDIYDISLFHQLHCLTGIRNHLYLLQGSIGRNNSQQIQDILLNPQVPHVQHCFDYIRQALMCAGDMTIEWPRTEPDGSRFAFDGWGVAHECKSWDSILQYMSENSAYNALTA